MNLGSESNVIYAVRAMQPWEEGANYWIPLLYEELKNGRARFGWGYDDDQDVGRIESKIRENGWQALGEPEKKARSHAKFLLYVNPRDFLVYVNMPTYGRCTVVRISEGDAYAFDTVWDPAQESDFRHRRNCEFVYTFDRASDAVHPTLRAKLGLKGAHWRVYAENEFYELLEALRTGEAGRSAEERLREEVDTRLEQIAVQIQRNYPRRSFEDYLLKTLRNLPGVSEVRRGPDVNGADLELDFEAGLEIEGLQRTEICAVQAKAYEGTIGYTQAIEDITRAFASNPDYTCGLIISTALERTQAFDEQLEKLRSASGKEVGILIGKELARLLLKYAVGGFARSGSKTAVGAP